MPTSSNETGLPRRRGRPRLRENDLAIRNAAWQLLAERGYDGLSFEGVADLSGCSRTSLYRRFQSKADLVATLLYEHARELEAEMQPTSSPRAALIVHSRNCAELFGGERGQAWLNVSSSAQREPELQARLKATIGNDRQFYIDAFRALAPCAQPANWSLACNSLIGGIMLHVASERRILKESELEALVDAAITLLGQESLAE